MCADFGESMKNPYEKHTTAAMHRKSPKENGLVNFSPVQPPHTREIFAANYLFNSRATPLRRWRKHNTIERSRNGT